MKMSNRDFLCLDGGDDWLHTPGLCSFGPQQSGTTQTIQKSDPWSGQQPALSDIYNQAMSNNAANRASGGPAYYPNSTYQGLTPDQKGLISNLIGQTGIGGGTGLRAANSSLTDMLGSGYTAGTAPQFGKGQAALSNELSPGYLNPWNSPSFGTVVGNTLASVMPSITHGFINGNRSDSGLATRAATMGATDAIGNLAQNQYNANQAIQQQGIKQASDNFLAQQGNQLKAAGVTPFVDQATNANYQTALQTAGIPQQDLQNQITADMARYNYNQMLPWNQLGLYENAVTGTGSPGGTTSTSQPYFSNPMASALSAGTGLLGAGAAANSLGLFSASTYAPLLGFLGMSDRRVKEDIHKIGVSDSGFPLYTFRYKGETPMSMHIGLMAQDVEKVRPEAVLTTPSGIKMVDYIGALA